MTITIKDEQILKLLTDDYLTVIKVSSLLKISRQAVYKHITKLKEKGLLKGSSMRGFTKANLSHKGGFTFRLHDIELRLILPTESRYKKRTVFYKGSRSHIYRYSVRVWSKDKHFYANSIKECYNQADVFFSLLIQFLEDKYKISIQGVETSHTGEIEKVGCRMAEAVNKEGYRWQFRGPDHKVWLETDKSLKRENSEVKHPETSREDGELIFEGIYNSWRNGTAFTPQKGTEAIYLLIQAQKTTQKQLDYYAKNNASHAMLLQDLRVAVRSLAKNVNYKMKKRSIRQKELGGFFHD